MRANPGAKQKLGIEYKPKREKKLSAVSYQLSVVGRSPILLCANAPWPLRLWRFTTLISARSRIGGRSTA